MGRQLGPRSLGLLAALLCAAPARAQKVWKAVGSLSSPRAGHTAARLPSGNVLVAGGDLGSFRISTAEVYRVATGTWMTVGSLMGKRGLHTAGALPDGRVIQIGGLSDLALVNQTEIFDEAKGTFALGPALNGSRAQHAVAALSLGRILVAGGSASVLRSDAEVYDPTTNKFDWVGSMGSVRLDFTLTTLGDGRVLAVGGSNDTDMLSTAEIYDPAVKSWKAVAPMATRREAHLAILLADGRVLVAGGRTMTLSSLVTLTSSEIYDPAKNTWSKGPDLSVPRAFGAWAPLLDGRSLVLGGQDADVDLLVAGPSFVPTGPALLSRVQATATPLLDGRVLVAGGFFGATALADAEIFDPKPLPVGAACSVAGECGTSACVDGRCCATACADSCSACDVPGKEGTCAPISSAPRPGRPPCPLGVRICAAGACATSCSKPDDCATSHYCEASVCVVRKKSGAACARSVECASGACVDGVCCDRPCGGACEACDTPGKIGTCAPVTGQPRGGRPTCAPFVCGAEGCLATCAADTECATGFSCRGGVCVGTGRTCTADRLGSVDPATSKVTPCGAYRCREDGACGEACGTTDDCALGTVCDVGKKACVATADAPVDGGGCGVGGDHGPGWLAALGGALILAGRRRRSGR